jgi:hypothetical protein
MHVMAGRLGLVPTNGFGDAVEVPRGTDGPGPTGTGGLETKFSRDALAVFAGLPSGSAGLLSVSSRHENHRAWPGGN